MNMMKQLFFISGLVLLVGAGCLQKPVEQTPPVEGIAVGEPNGPNITLDALNDGDIVTSPLTISGRARAFENTIDWLVRSKSGDVLDQGYVNFTTKDIGEFGDFKERIFLPVIEENFTLEFFTLSARDGSVQDLVTRELTVASDEKTSVSIFFLDPSLQEDGDCSEVDFEKRTVGKTQNVAELAILELLKGPTSDWAVTLIPEFTTLNSISIENGTAKVDFDSRIDAWSGGSCQIAALTAQVEQTLKQFPTVDDVEISVNGESETILQP